MRAALARSIMRALLLATACQALVAPRLQRVQPPRLQRAQPRCRAAAAVSMSAKVLPATYALSAAALAYKATAVATAPEAAVCVTTALLAAVDLGPTANAQLASAKRAMKATAPASAGAAKAKRQAALTWRKAVRIKIVGQVLGLASMAVGDVFQGAACTLAANLGFWFVGAGAARHDGDGVLTPVPPGLVRIIFCIDALICLGAYAASRAPPASAERLLSAGFVVGGMLFGILEKLPKLFLPKVPPGGPEAAAN